MTLDKLNLTEEAKQQYLEAALLVRRYRDHCEGKITYRDLGLTLSSGAVRADVLNTHYFIEGLLING